MRKIFITLILLLSFFQIKAQIKNINSRKYSLAKKHFETKYEKQEYSKYLKSQIKSSKNKVVIDAVKVFEFSADMDDGSRLILENGLLDPMRINGSHSVKISIIHELTLLNPNYKIKRFSFWIYRREKPFGNSTIQNVLNNRINPDEYYFELQNENAKENTSFKEFVEGAKLTYLSLGTVII